MKEEKSCVVCGEKAEEVCSSCDSSYCRKHYKTTVLTGNCCRGNEEIYQ